MAASHPRAVIRMMGEFGCDFPLWWFGELGRDVIDLHPETKSELTFWAGYFDNFASLGANGEVAWARAEDASWYAERGRALAKNVAEALGTNFAIELDLSDGATVSRFHAAGSPVRAEAALSAHRFLDSKESRDSGMEALHKSGVDLRWTVNPPLTHD